MVSNYLNLNIYLPKHLQIIRLTNLSIFGQSFTVQHNLPESFYYIFLFPSSRFWCLSPPQTIALHPPKILQRQLPLHRDLSKMHLLLGLDPDIDFPDYFHRNRFFGDSRNICPSGLVH